MSINLHHLGQEILRHLETRAPNSLDLATFSEDAILGAPGALKNASAWLRTDAFLLVNGDKAIEPGLAGLLTVDRESGRLATLLVVENREPRRDTPLQAERHRIIGLRGNPPRPLADSGIGALSGRLLQRLPAGETSLVTDLWEAVLAGGEETGCLAHYRFFVDLGRLSDFLGAPLEALVCGGPLPRAGGRFEALLWPGPDGQAMPFPLVAASHGFHSDSPRR